MMDASRASSHPCALRGGAGGGKMGPQKPPARTLGCVTTLGRLGLPGPWCRMLPGQSGLRVLKGHTMAWPLAYKLAIQCDSGGLLRDPERCASNCDTTKSHHMRGITITSKVQSHMIPTSSLFFFSCAFALLQTGGELAPLPSADLLAS